MIEFSGVTKKYKNGTEALKNVSMKIEKGEFVFVVGSSGAGKSTLIKTLLREEAPTSGTVFVNGFNLNRMKRRHIPKFRRSLGVVFQDFRLIPNLTVYDNVAFALRVTNVVSKEIRVRVPYVLKLLGLSDKAKCFPDQISGGEQQRVALARALVNNPAIIVADEPTGNIDPELSFEIVDLLSAINEQAGTTIVMVTHEHELVNYFNKRVITIEDGMVVSDTLSGKAGLFTGQELMEDYGRGLTSKQKAQDYNKRTAARQQQAQQPQPAQKPQPPKQPIDFSRARASDLMQDYDDNFPSGYQFSEFSDGQDLAFGGKN
jgi:cell division transport system ATP-binding protein